MVVGRQPAARRDAARFAAAFTVVLAVAIAIAVLGFDPLQLTLLCVALTVVIMPLVVLPFLALMNDRSTSRHTRAGRWATSCWLC